MSYLIDGVNIQDFCRYNYTVKENIIISSLGRKDHPAGMQIAAKEAGLAYVSGMNQPPQWTLWLKAVCTGTF